MLAYFDLYSGASGDMLVGALLDAGLDLAALRDGLDALPLSGYTVSAEAVMKGAIGATAFRVRVTEPQPARHLDEILALIDGSSLPPDVREHARRTFTTLGRAEAHVHRIPIEKVHFHEVGAVDSIVDIVGTCLALSLLGVEEVYAAPVPVAHGTLRVEHGWLPMPGPATLEILAAANAPLISPPTPTAGELVTPTGAALICSLATFEQPPMTLRRVGCGAGARDLSHPNVLRVWLGERSPLDRPALPLSDTPTGAETEDLCVVETNIDDMNPQVYGYLFDHLLVAGALDVYCTPITMKKNRPGTMLSILCRGTDAARFEATLLRETTTLGVRTHLVRRTRAERTEETVETPLGPIRVKIKRLAGHAMDVTPEYEDCAAIARRQARPLLEILNLAKRCAEESIAARGGVS